MKKTAMKYMALFISGYILLFALRLGYGYLKVSEQPIIQAFTQSVVNFRSDIKNYASEKRVMKSDRQLQAAMNVSVDQKYEKVATVAARSGGFASDEVTLRKTVSEANALIQFEQSSGLSGNRRLHMVIGVQPARFDEFVEALKKIGELASIEIDKIDKTSEYKGLNASRASLEKSRASLEALRKLNGSVQEMIELEGKILDNEQQMQKLGVQLKEFDEECEFCTVKFTLVEHRAVMPAEITFAHRLKVAFEWTTVYYAYLIFVLSGALFCSFLIVVIAGRLSWLPGYLNGPEAGKE